MAKGDILEEVSLTDSSGGTTDTTVVEFASVPAEGDLLVFLVVAAAAAIDTAPGSVTEILSRDMTGPNIKGYYAIADGITDTFSFSFAANSNSGVKALRFEGPYEVGDLEVMPSSTGQGHESTTTVTILSAAESVAVDSLVVAVLWYPYPSVSTTPIDWTNSFTPLVNVGPNNCFLRTATKQYPAGANDIQTVATIADGASWGYSWLLAVPRDAGASELTYSFGGLNAGLIL